jgi:hypothetical protein
LLADLLDRREQIREARLLLLSEWREQFHHKKGSARVIALAQSRGKSLKGISWRVADNGHNKDASKRVGLESDYGRQLLSSFDLDVQRIIFAFDRERMMINYAESINRYKVQRTKDLIMKMEQQANLKKHYRGKT